MPRRVPLACCTLVLAGAVAHGQPAARGATHANYRIEQFSSNNGLPQNSVSAIAQTPDGYLWLGTYDGLVRFDGLRFTTYDRGTLPAMRRTQVLNLNVDGAGALWTGTDLGVLRYAAGAFEWREPLADADGRRHAGDARRQPGYVPPLPAEWRVEGGALVHAPAGSNSTGRWPLPDSTLMVAGEDRSGIVWLYGNREVTQFARGEFREIAAREFTGSRAVRTAFVDREGTVWLGTNESGLFRVTPRVLTTYSVEEGLAARNVYPVAEDFEGRIWMGTGQALTRWERGVFSRFRFVRSGDGAIRLEPIVADSAPPGGVVVRTMVALPDGRMLVAVANAILTVDDRRIVATRSLGDRTVDALLVARDGALWVATDRGLMRQRGDSLMTLADGDGYPASPAFVMYEDRGGSVWIGTRRGLVRWDGTRLTTFTERDGLGSNFVRSLYEDDTGALWIGTFDGGLTRFKHGTFRTVTTHNGLFANGVFQVLEDGAGEFWMSSNRGLFRVNRAQLDAVADGRATTVLSTAYGAPEGMRQAEANGGRPPAGVRARDGRLWFPTTDGVVVIDPMAVRRGMVPPVVAIGTMTVDGADRRAVSGTVRVAPGENTLAIEYAAPTSINAANVHVRWRLRRVDDHVAWTDGGTTRAVTFTRLVPGRYLFEAVASNAEGRWGVHPTTVTVEVIPHFWQTAWFALLVALLVGSGSAAAYRVRVAALKAQERRLTALVAERTAELRVANDRLHELATHDALTQLANKRRLDEFLAAEWHRSARTATPMALLAIDVDHFKQFNDTYGHPAGDECLRRVATVLREGVRGDTDFAARQGGEEFAVVLTGTSTEGAHLVAESLRATVEGLGIPHDASSVAGVVTISVGMASLTADGHADVATLVAAADAALYEAKRGGRNRVSGA